MDRGPDFAFRMLPSPKSRANPIRATMERIAGYPRKLVIYQIPASDYWWIRYFAKGRYFKRSSGTEIRKDAIQIAKRFYDEINFKIHQGLTDRDVITFDAAADDLLKSEKAKLDRGQLSKITYDNRNYRLVRTVIPFFRGRDIARIDYSALDSFLAQLSKDGQKLSVSTISAYMG
ncbi:MAG: hypothetical protein NWS01_04915, partial [Burkholderiales bacterium]|nr:hypothetical protein [Burkholderiales bacterium]